MGLLAPTTRTNGWKMKIKEMMNLTKIKASTDITETRRCSALTMATTNTTLSNKEMELAITLRKHLMTRAPNTTGSKVLSSAPRKSTCLAEM